jgi:hypothetical protein
VPSAGCYVWCLVWWLAGVRNADDDDRGASRRCAALHCTLLLAGEWSIGEGSCEAPFSLPSRHPNSPPTLNPVPLHPIPLPTSSTHTCNEFPLPNTAAQVPSYRPPKRARKQCSSSPPSRPADPPRSPHRSLFTAGRGLVNGHALDLVGVAAESGLVTSTRDPHYRYVCCGRSRKTATVVGSIPLLTARRRAWDGLAGLGQGGIYPAQ